MTWLCMQPVRSRYARTASKQARQPAAQQEDWPDDSYLDGVLAHSDSMAPLLEADALNPGGEDAAGPLDDLLSQVTDLLSQMHDLCQDD